MNADAIGCCHGRRKSRSGPRCGAVGGALFAALAALMPKCPLCVAAWLGVVGLSGLAARVDARAVWLGAAAAVAFAAALGARRILGRDDIKKGDVT